MNKVAKLLMISVLTVLLCFLGLNSQSKDRPEMWCSEDGWAAKVEKTKEY